ncbi:TPA: GNAT family N-acetyltransferase [Legionella pneumophila]|uniref:GNAT family N-acetyltransferase n=1 Tax=Legionella pneumophila TaxID=446 RepID=UPI0029900665|nr:GNAT family N-acetyltransferase [Legionella pneumophila]MDW8993554.1 GNAT family N-acetyltransferase [Legionella pneumophila]MDW9000004.1 GNAT family N-acetyltransferase [Legionella pneumophila]MDW9002994.1 GNAT family N-acetyltransferase [Legionella pneumophila]
MEIILRAATINDASNLFEWRNALEIRRYSSNPNPIEIADHLRWLQHSLVLPNRRLLIAEHQNNPIGVLRFDIDVLLEQAEVSIYLVPGLAGKGWGTKILESGTEWIKNNLPQIRNLVAKILADNVSSQRAFEKAGYDLNSYIYKKLI